MLQTDIEDVSAGLSGATSPRSEHAFSRIPIHPPIAGVIQTKLAINNPGDEYEQEADRVADQVMRMTEPTAIASSLIAIQRQCAVCDDGEEVSPVRRTKALAQQALSGQADNDEPFAQPIILRKAQFSAPHETPTSPQPIADRLVARQAGGEPLPAETRHRMEHAFGHDFSRVRIHRDAEAGEMSRQLSALAFTHGNNIYFAHGSYDPHGASGKRLLAHELTHVVQQGQAAPQQGAGPVLAGATMAPAIQRFALWRAGTVNEVNNLADGFVNGRPAGFTPPMLNGAIILSPAAARAAIRRPTLSFTPAASGGVNAKVTDVPINVGSFEENVLAPGPWTTVAPKATIGARFPALAACAGAGNSTFRTIGDPSDAQMFAANRRHEDHHAADHEAAYNGSLVTWDSNLIVAQVLNEEFHGPTQADAEAALFARVGGTPDQKAEQFFNEAIRLGQAFHATPAGGPVGAPTDPQANADCSTSSAKFTNPS